MHDKLTRQDIALMEKELEDRRMNIRPAIMEEVKRTRAFGDLSENYEYKAAKDAQRKNDSRVRYLENMIKTAKIIDEDKGRPGGVKLYDRVTLWLPEDEEEMVIQVVSTVRTNPSEGRISLESPLGKAVLGAKLGDILTIRVNESYAYDAEIRAIEEAADDGTAPLLPY
ncbi:MAG: GreA/GreB family elongation factor [Oscillospiraceae bacterium]|nr:GreA/GreB family elongation factor [Oscillospiraceae bacterium]MBR6118865.1 GreA/GreB family elongation factor [Oscillospiraceae bacterium]MBR7009625.1 GreA/GreB family elongation factor [Oscillospiraceae bacterium]